MSEPKYREWILDTIDSLRSRKARPDLERICRMVRRRHGSEPDRTCAELEKLIQEQTVLKVNYKGSISYRNAAKVQRRSRKKDDASLTTAARRSAVEEASHSDLSNGDSAFGTVDQDDEDLEVCGDFRAGVTFDVLSCYCHVTALHSQVQANMRVWLKKGNKREKTREGEMLLSCLDAGSGEGSDLQVHPKLPQTGSGGWTSLERCRREERKVRVRCKSASFHSCVAKRVTKTSPGLKKQSCFVLPDRNKHSLHISGRKRVSSPKLGV